MFFINISCAFIICSGQVFAQQTEVKGDSVEVKIKPPREALYLSGVRFGADLTKLALTGINPDFSGAEVRFEFLVNNKFFFPIEYGIADITRTDDLGTFEYNTTGSYFRTGFDYCSMHKKTDNHALNVGLRYGSASFDNSVQYSREDDYWGSFENTVEENGLNISWFEMVVGMKYMFVKNLYIGLDARLKFKLSASGGEVLSVAEAPGFGITRSNTRPELNYSILYRIPFGKKITLLKAREARLMNQK